MSQYGTVTEPWEVRRRSWRRQSVYPLVAAGIITGLSVLVPMLLALNANPEDHRPVITLVGMFIAGIVGQRWLTLVVVVPTYIITLMVFDVSVVVFLGYERWDSLNPAEMGDSLRDLTEFLEAIAFGFLYGILTTAGILIRKAADSLYKFLTAVIRRAQTRSQ